MNLGQYIAQQLLENDQYVIGVFPGAFKPPHKGHFNVVKKLADMCDEVQVLISPKTRDGVTVDESVAVWELYKTLLPANVNFLVAEENPVKETYSLITSNPDAKIIAAFGKDEYTRFNSILSNEKYKNAELFNAGNFDGISATDFRIAIRSKKEDLIQKFLPEGIDVKQFMDAAGYTMGDTEKEPLKEGKLDLELLKKFISFTLRELGIEGSGGKIVISGDTKKAREMKSMGLYSPQDDKIWVYTGNRNMADICRTVSHELVHLSQKQKGQTLDGTTGSDTENEANSKAGQIMRKFAQKNPMIFEAQDPNPMKFKIYCDMDGVLVDFEKGYEELTGVDLKGSHVNGDASFWQPIADAGESFWTDLNWMSDGMDLWEYIKRYNPKLLSAPSRDKSSRTGKQKWVEENIPGTPLLLKSAELKQLYASPTSILIDDRKDNVQRWREAGGIGILHTSAADTIQQLKDLGL
jgi:cytidyltransferase-like protein